MNSQETFRKSEEQAGVTNEMPLDPFAVDIFGSAKPISAEEYADLEFEDTPEQKVEIAKERSAWNAGLPQMSSEEVAFSNLLQNLPRNLTRRATDFIAKTVARYTFQNPKSVKCRLLSAAEANLPQSLEQTTRRPQVFLTLGCQPDNSVAVIALDTNFASSVIDLTLGSGFSEYKSAEELSPIENAIIEFISINILNEINDWLGKPILSLQKVSGDVPEDFEPLERGAESIFQLDFDSFGGVLTFFSGWNFLNGLDQTNNPLFEKKSAAAQISKLEENSFKFDLRLPVGTTRLSAEDILYLEEDDVILVEQAENTFDGTTFSGDLQLYVGSGKNFLLSGTALPEDTNGGAAFKIDEITRREERSERAPSKIKMEEKEIEETELNDGAEPDESEQTAETEESENEAILNSVLVNLRVEIAGDKISLNELRNLRSGQILELGCRPTDPVRIVTDSSDQPIAAGELIDIEGKLGVRVTRVFV